MAYINLLLSLMQVCSQKWDVTFTSLAFRLGTCIYFAYSDDTPLQIEKFGAHDTAVWIYHRL